VKIELDENLPDRHPWVNPARFMMSATPMPANPCS
jgi:hypothetical protein